MMGLSTWSKGPLGRRLPWQPRAGWKGLGAIKAMPVGIVQALGEGGHRQTSRLPWRVSLDASVGHEGSYRGLRDGVGHQHGDNPDDARWGLDGIKADVSWPLPLAGYATLASR